MGTKHTRRARRSAAVLLLSFLVSLLLAAPLAAQSSDAEFEVLRVDLTGEEGLVVVRTPTVPERVDIGISSGGEELSTVTSTVGNSVVNGYTVLVIDDSRNGDVIAGFSRIRESALAYLSSINAGTRVMLVRGGGGNPDAEAIVAFTSDHGRIRAEIEAMQPEGGSVVWNAISRSAEALSANGSGVRSVVAFVASEGGASTVSPEVAQGNLLTANAGLTLVLPQSPNANYGSYVNVSNQTRGGGVFRGAGDATMVEAAVTAGNYHRQTFVASFATADLGESATTLTVLMGEGSQRVRVVPGIVTQGSSLVAPDVATTGRFEVLTSDTAAMIAIALGVVAALLFSFSMMQILAGSDNTLNHTLAMYSADDRSEEKKAADDAFASVRSKIVEQVVEKAETAAASTGNLANTTTMLQKAEIPLRTGEAMAVQVGIVVIAFLLGLIVLGGPIGGLILALMGATIPMMYVKFKVKRRTKKLEQQLPDVLTLLSSTLKAGYSFLQGIDAVGNEAEEPLAGEFRRTVNEARLGRDMDDALDDLAERVGSVDLLWAVVAIKIQREVGGNLAELLMTVADTMTARTRLRGEINALTAEGRMSAYVLVLLPLGVGVAMYMMNRDYIATLWSHPFGYAAMVAGVLGMVVGSVWMRKIIDISI